MDVNLINHGVCEHITDKCSVRDIVYYNIFTDKVQKIRVCNEWFRLNFIEFCRQQKYPGVFDYYLSDFVKSTIIETILQKEENFIIENTSSNSHNRWNNNPFKMRFSIEMCRRPRIYWTFKLYDLIQLQIELNNKHEYGREWILYYKLVEIFKKIKNDSNNNIYFLKNPKIKPIINKIIDRISLSDELEIELNNLLITILNNVK